MFEEKCVAGLKVNEDRCWDYVEQSLALVTGLVPHLGCDQAANIAKEAYETGQSIDEVLKQRGDLDSDRFRKMIDPENMVGR